MQTVSEGWCGTFCLQEPLRIAPLDALKIDVVHVSEAPLRSEELAEPWSDPVVVLNLSIRSKCYEDSCLAMPECAASGRDGLRPGPGAR